MPVNEIIPTHRSAPPVALIQRARRFVFCEPAEIPKGPSFSTALSRAPWYEVGVYFNWHRIA